MLGKHIVRQFIIQILGVFVGFITSIITTRILGASGRGDFALILNTSAFLNLVLGFSLGPGIVHFVSSEKAPLREIINTISLIILVLTVLCIFLMLFFPFRQFDFFLPAESPQGFNESIILVLFITMLYSMLFNALISGKQLFQHQQKSYLFFIMPFSLISYLLLYYVSKKTEIEFTSFMLFYVFLSIVPVLILFIIYLKYARPTFSFTFLKNIQLKHILNFSFLAYLANMFQFLSYRMDFWFIQYYSGSKQLGFYSLSVNLAQLLWLLPQAVSSILISYSGSGDEQVAINQTNILSRISITILFCATIFLELSIHLIIPFLYGKEFEESVFTFQLLLIGIMPFSITTILASYFAGKGIIKINLYGSLLGFLICLVFDFLLIPSFGIKGAAFATICSYLFSTAFTVFVYLRKTKSSLSELLIITKTDVLMLKNKINSKFLFQEK